MKQEHVVWGAAAMMLRRYGDQAPVKVAERIGAMVMQNDDAGRATWKQVARCMDQMMNSTVEH